MPTLKVALSILWKIAYFVLLAVAWIYAIDRIKFFWSISSVHQSDFYFYYYAFEIIHQHEDPSLLYNRTHLIKWLLHHGNPQFDSSTFFGFYGYPPHFAVLLSKGYFFLLSLALVSHGFISDAYLGQSNRLLFFLLSASLYLFYKKKDAWLAGIPLVIAIIFKLTPVIFIFFLFLLRRQWRVCFSTFLFTLLSTFFTASMVGWVPYSRLLAYPS